jgi:hypothetical protein
MANALRTMKRQQRRENGQPEKNALSPKNTRGAAKGPARSPTQAERFEMLRLARAMDKARAEKVAAESVEKAA